MVDRPCRGHLDLFPSTKVNNMLKKFSNNNNDIVPFLHVLTGSQINININNIHKVKSNIYIVYCDQSIMAYIIIITIDLQAKCL